ncbi:DUF2071 domain-containing protein [Natrinema pallidum]
MAGRGWYVADQPTPSMTWRDRLFTHWPVTPDALRPHVPG